MQRYEDKFFEFIVKVNSFEKYIRLEEGHYTQIAQYFEKYTLSLPQEHLEQ